LGNRPIHYWGEHARKPITAVSAAMAGEKFAGDKLAHFAVTTVPPIWVKLFFP
jgi:hypothetical protein